MAGKSIDDISTHDPDPEAISIAHCRVLLGDQALDLSDDEVDAIRRHAHTMAHVLIEMFLTSAARA